MAKREISFNNVSFLDVLSGALAAVMILLFVALKDYKPDATDGMQDFVVDYCGMVDSLHDAKKIDDRLYEALKQHCVVLDSLSEAVNLRAVLLMDSIRTLRAKADSLADNWRICQQEKSRLFKFPPEPKKNEPQKTDDDEDHKKEDRVIAKIVVAPAYLNLKPGQSTPLYARAYNKAGREVPDVKFSWKTSDPALVELVSGGDITASREKEGLCTITASAGGVSGIAKVEVEDRTPPPPPGVLGSPCEPIPFKVTLTPQCSSDKFSAVKLWLQIPGGRSVGMGRKAAGFSRPTNLITLCKKFPGTGQKEFTVSARLTRETPGGLPVKCDVTYLMPDGGCRTVTTTQTITFGGNYLGQTIMKFSLDENGNFSKL